MKSVSHRVHALGVSNIPHLLLLDLYDSVDVKPSCIQVRFHPETNWEISTRRFCASRGIVFQAHKVLKQKQALLNSELMGEISTALGVSKYVAIYLCVLGLGDYMSIVSGPKSEGHMKEDVEGLKRFRSWLQNRTVWDGYVTRFKAMIGE